MLRFQTERYRLDQAPLTLVEMLSLTLRAAESDLLFGVTRGGPYLATTGISRKLFPFSSTQLPAKNC